jgi:hypothetical protein
MCIGESGKPLELYGLEAFMHARRPFSGIAKKGKKM